MEQQEKSQKIKNLELAVTASALFMVLVGLVLYFFREMFGLDMATAKMLVLVCVGIGLVELFVIKKLVVRLMTK